MWEFVKTAGSVAGLVTAMFVIWDRLFRNAPSAFIISTPLAPGGVPKAAYLRVVNRSERPLILSWPTGISENDLRLSVDHTLDQIVAATLDGTKSTAVGGNEQADFVVFKPERFDRMDKDQIMELEVLWRFAQPVIWQRERKLRVRISKKSYQLLVDEVD